MILYVFRLYFAPAFEDDLRWQSVHIRAKNREIAFSYVKSRWGTSRYKVEYSNTVYEVYSKDRDAPVFYSA